MDPVTIFEYFDPHDYATISNEAQQVASPDACIISRQLPNLQAVLHLSHIGTEEVHCQYKSLTTLGGERVTARGVLDRIFGVAMAM